MPDRFFAIGGAPNWIEAEDTTFTSGVSAAAGMPLSNLATQEPSDLARLPSINAAKTTFGAAIDPGPWFGGNEVPVGIVGLVNHNLSPGATYRFVLSNDLSDELSEIAPDAIASSTNASGAVTDIDDDPHDPDANYVTPTTGTSDMDVRVTFPTPGSAPGSGADRQLFQVEVKAGGAPSLTTADITIELWEGGSKVATLLEVAKTATTPAETWVLYAPWNAADLGTADGSLVECKVLLSAGSGVQRGSVGAIRWVVDTKSGIDADSGWLSWDIADETTWGQAQALFAAAPQQTAAWLPAASTDTPNVHFYARDPENPDGYIQAGVLVAGPVFIPSRVNFAEGELVQVQDPSPRRRVPGGQDYGSIRKRRRVMPVTFPSLTESEGFSLFHRLDWLKGTSGAVLVMAYPDGSAIQTRHTTLWATIEGEDLPPLTLSSGYGRHQKSYRFVEKL